PAVVRDFDSTNGAFVTRRPKAAHAEDHVTSGDSQPDSDMAREEALRIFDAVRVGKDPVTERRAYIDAPIVNDLLDRYVAEHVDKRNRPTTRERRSGALSSATSGRTLASIKVVAVTRQDLAKLHRSLAGTPRLANFVLAVCSKAFGLAELWGMRP